MPLGLYWVLKNLRAVADPVGRAGTRGRPILGG
jgi:hypothetical protein